MEPEKNLTEMNRKSFRVPWRIVISALSGLGLSVVVIVLSYPELGSRLRETSIPSDTSTTETVSSGANPSVFGPGSQQRVGNAQVGEPAPDFTLPTLEGDTVSLSDYRGRPVLMNFWATWCAPCRREMPELVRVYNTHRDEGFVVLAVDLADQDSIDDVRAFVEEFDMTFPVLLDETGAVYNELYRLLGLPMSVFVDREGIITRIHIGIMTDQQVDEFVEEILP